MVQTVRREVEKMKLEDLEKEELIEFIRSKDFFEEEIVLNVFAERLKQAQTKAADAEQIKIAAYDEIKELLESCQYVSTINGTKKYYFSRGEYIQNKEKIDRYVQAEENWWKLRSASTDAFIQHSQAWNDWFKAKYKDQLDVV